MVHRSITRAATAALLGGVSLIGLAVPAHAARVLFSTNAALNGKDLAPETEVIVENGITQVQLANGAVAAFVDGAQFSLRPNGALDLRGGTVTVVSPTGSPVSVMMPDGVVGSIEGENASASFTVTAKGARGSVLGGKAAVMANGVTHIYATGSFWLAAKGHAPEQIIANTPAAVPGAVRPMREGGIAAAAENGIPVALGEALAAVGANGDIVTAAHRVEAYDRDPSLTAFPRGDYALLTAFAAQAAAPFGGAAFNGAGADIVRTYFQFLASGRQPGDFRAAYAQSLLGYLDLLRSGALPSGFTGATQAQLSAYIAFIGRTDGFGALSATNRNLLDAYLAFLSGGGTPDGFGVRASTLVGSYLDYLRAGGDPAKFAAASAAVVAQYLEILQSSGIKSQLTPANQALLNAYLVSLAKTGNGLAFSNGAATSLAAFTAYLNGGGFPSQYSAADAASIRAYLETLNATGLFDRVLGNQAVFLRSYLVFLQGGGSADAFDKLPINVLTAQANALGGYYVFIQNGGTPSSYAALTQAQINAYLKALKDVGLFDALLGANARFLSDYYAYLLQGGNPDLYAGLPNVDLNAYAAQVATYVAYLKSGNLPSGYTTLTAQQLRDYLNALSASGKLTTLLGGDATFLASYLAYLQGGGVPDQFNGLPIYTYTAYSSQLAAFVAYLNGGGLPSGYTTLTATQIRSYLEALQASGQLAALLGANANFFTTYLVYLQGGGSADGFTGLPIVTYRSYATALSAFYIYLAGGGRPSAYTVLTAVQIKAYLDALSAADQATVLLGDNATFFVSYLTYLTGGGSPDQYAGLPTGGMPPSPVVPRYAYAGGFPASGGKPYIVTTAIGVGYNGTVDTNGVLQSIDGNIGRGTSTAVDIAGDASVVVGRWTNGTLSNGLTATATGIPYVVLAPITGTLPTRGTLDYSILAATQPVYASGKFTPGVFSGNLTIGFGPALTYGIDGTIVIPETNGKVTYAFASPNRMAGVANALAYQGPFLSAALTGSGIACTSGTNCRIVFNGGFAGATPADRIGLAYQTIDDNRTNQEQIDGTVIFGRNGTFTPGTPPLSPVLSDAGVYVPVGAATSYLAAVTNPGSKVGNNGEALTGTFTASGGVPTSIVLDNNQGASNVAYNRGTATTVEAGGDQFASIGRWTNGTVGGYGLGARMISANQGVHYLVEVPSASVPQTGELDYSIFAKTSPTWDSLTTAPGTFDAKLRMVFSANSYKGYVLGSIVMPEASGLVTYSIGKQSEYDSRTNYSIFSTSYGINLVEAFTGAGQACSAGTNCQIFFRGGPSGPNAARVGFTYTTIFGFAPSIQGAVIFGADGTFTPGTVPAPASPTTTAVATGYTLGNTGNDQPTITVSAANGIESFTASSAAVVARGTALIAQSGATAGTTADDRIYWTRWAGGKSASTDTTQVIDVPADGGIHLLHLPPATAIPISGTAQYTLVGGTSPTIADGSVAPGTFTGTLGVDFKSAKVGIDFNVAIGGFNYAIATAGKAIAPTNGGLTFATFTNGNGAVNSYGFNDQIAVTPGGPACAGAATCTAYLTGLASGTGASGFGVSYGIQVPRNGGATKVSGVAAFAGTYTSAAEPPTLVGAPTGAALRYSRTGNFTRAVDVVADPDGKLTSLIGSYLRGTATDHENGGLASIIGWTRWSGGSPQGPGEGTAAIPINGGVGRIWGVPATAVPTAGIATYDLAGSTAVTAENGSLAPGKIQTASLAVDFGKGKVGFESTFSVGGVDYAIASRGGVAAPFMFLGVNNEFYGVQQAVSYVNVTGNGCRPDTCPASAAGFLAGPGASHAGISFNFYNPDAAGFAGAAIAFAKHP